MKKSKIFNYLIILYGLILIIIFLGFNNFYGSNVDWISQHSVLPEYFRSLFYETKNLFPNFAFNLGAGQNIYNFSYYGLLNPVILISYLLPFIKMIYFIQISSVILFIFFGLLMFKFLKNNFNDSKLAFMCSIFSMTIASVNFNFHHHIMFVWYLPFLIIALLGIDKYISTNKSWLLILGTFLLIMTNYYFSIASLIVIYIYGVYKIMKEKNINLKNIIFKCLFLGIRLIIPILMAMIILLPTLGALKSVSRGGGEIQLFKLITPNFKELFYKYSALGINGIFYLAIIGNFFNKKFNKANLFLYVSIFLVLSFSVFMYHLNGGLYIRGKVLIPFIPLIMLCYGNFFKSLFNKELNIKKFQIFLFSFLTFSFIFNFSNIFYCLVIFISFMVIISIFKMNNKKLFIFYTFIVLFIGSFVCNKFENYVLVDEYNDMNINNVEKIFKKINDRHLYRSYNNIIPKNDPNKVYSGNYFSPSIYSSTYNDKYWKFYNFNFGNNISYRNKFITTGTNNELFYTFMGVKYISSLNDIGMYYKKIDEINDVSLYYNKDAYPLCYVSKDVGDLQVLKNLKFPYNVEYLMNKTVVKEYLNDNSYETRIKKYSNNNLVRDYKFQVKADTIKKIYLDKNLEGKILYIKFDMKKNQSCKKGDTFININGISNKLTCKEWLYHNQNKVFNYIIPLNMKEPYLEIEIGTGSYNIENVEVYYSDILKDKKQELNNLKINKKKEVITGNITLDKDNYLVTSIPYDDGFKIYVNNKEVEKKIVNTAFLGAKLSKGNNNVRIEYHAPLFESGKILSILGFIFYGIILICENNFRKLIRKNK